MTINAICVFAGSSDGNNPAFRHAASELGTALARRQLKLIYGGASVGLMGCVADAALEGGGTVIGVLPEVIARQELAHPALTELHVVDSMHERKALMADLADGFIALPGGLGTLEETFEVLTWNQLMIHSKPVGLLNTDGFYDGLLTFLDHVVAQGFVRSEHRAMLHAANDADTLIEELNSGSVPKIRKW